MGACSVAVLYRSCDEAKETGRLSESGRQTELTSYPLGLTLGKQKLKRLPSPTVLLT